MACFSGPGFGLQLDPYFKGLVPHSQTYNFLYIANNLLQVYGKIWCKIIQMEDMTEF